MMEHIGLEGIVLHTEVFIKFCICLFVFCVFVVASFESVCCIPFPLMWESVWPKEKSADCIFTVLNLSHLRLYFL